MAWALPDVVEGDLLVHAFRPRQTAGAWGMGLVLAALSAGFQHTPNTQRKALPKPLNSNFCLFPFAWLQSWFVWAPVSYGDQAAKLP